MAVMGIAPLVSGASFVIRSPLAGFESPCKPRKHQVGTEVFWDIPLRVPGVSVPAVLRNFFQDMMNKEVMIQRLDHLGHI